MRKRWWLLRFYLLRVLFGTPAFFAASVMDGVNGFREDFGRTWANRWRASDAEEAWERFGKPQEAGEVEG